VFEVKEPGARAAGKGVETEREFCDYSPYRLLKPFVTRKDVAANGPRGIEEGGVGKEKSFGLKVIWGEENGGGGTKKDEVYRLEPDIVPAEGWDLKKTKRKGKQSGHQKPANQGMKKDLR